MANHKSAAKRARQSVKRNELNRTRRAKVRTVIKSLDKALSEGAVPEVKAALIKAQSALARAASQGTIHKKTASRKTSRLARRVKKAAQA